MALCLIVLRNQPVIRLVEYGKEACVKQRVMLDLVTLVVYVLPVQQEQAVVLVQQQLQSGMALAA
jgi:hypothetical protein